MLAKTPELYDALDAKGFAWCGLAVAEQAAGGRRQEAGGGHPPALSAAEGSSVEQAIAAFRAARAINRDAGIVARVVRLLDALAWAAPEGTAVVAETRKVAGGDYRTPSDKSDGY